MSKYDDFIAEYAALCRKHSMMIHLADGTGNAWLSVYTANESEIRDSLEELSEEGEKI